MSFDKPRKLTSREIDYICDIYDNTVIDAIKQNLREVELVPSGIDEFKSLLHCALNSNPAIPVGIVTADSDPTYISSYDLHLHHNK